MVLLNKLKKLSFLFWSLGFALLGGLSAKAMLVYLELKQPVQSLAIPVVKPINLKLNSIKTLSAIADLPKKPITNIDDLPNTQLSVNVLGFIITANEQNSVVVLNFNGKEITLGLNDELDAGIKLTRILPYRLVFSNQGNLEKYDWQEEEPKLDFNSGVEQSDIAADKYIKSVGTSQAGNNYTSEKNSVSFNENVAKKQTITNSKGKHKDKSQKTGKPSVQFASTAPLVEKFGDDFRTKLLKNPFQLAKYMRLTPARRDGYLIGYAVYPASDASLFEAFKLKAGDVLLSVNGMPTNDPSRLSELMKMLSEITDLNIELERDGNPITITLNL